MRLKSWPLAAAVLAASASPAWAVAGASCQLQQIGEVPARLEHSQPLLEATVNGTKVWFLADTGAETSSLSSDGARRLGLKPTRDSGVDLVGVGGSRLAGLVTLRELALGAYKASNIPLLVAGEHLGRSADVVGLIGRDILTKADVEFDLEHGKVRFFRPKNCASSNLGYWTKEPLIADIDSGWRDQDQIRFRIGVNGRRIEAMLDTGAAKSVITPEGAYAVGLGARPPEKPVDRMSGLGPETVESRLVTVDKLELGDETVSHVRLHVADLFSFSRETMYGSHIVGDPYDMPVMLIGADFLRAHRLLIAVSQKRLYFTYNGGPIFNAGPAEVPSQGKAAPNSEGGASR